MQEPEHPPTSTNPSTALSIFAHNLIPSQFIATSKLAGVKVWQQFLIHEGIATQQIHREHVQPEIALLDHSPINP